MPIVVEVCYIAIAATAIDGLICPFHLIYNIFKIYCKISILNIQIAIMHDYYQVHPYKLHLHQSKSSWLKMLDSSVIKKFDQ